MGTRSNLIRDLAHPGIGDRRESPRVSTREPLSHRSRGAHMRPTCQHLGSRRECSVVIVSLGAETKQGGVWVRFTCSVEEAAKL